MSGKKNFFIGALVGIVSVIAVNFAINSFALGSSYSFGSSFINPRSGKQTPGPTSATGKTALPDNAAMEEKVEDIYKILDSHYVGDYDKQETVEAMYSGLVYGVGDPYTNYFDAETYNEFIDDTEGTYAGIGVVVSVDEKDNRILVVSPFEGSPGQRAGIIPGDKIIKVNDYEVFGDTLDEAISMMKGEPGTSVKVTIYRETTKETKDMDIVRENIQVETVSHKMLENDIGYLRISQFDRVTYDQFVKAYNDLNAKNMKGLVIDLRNNPGGLLNIVCDITDMLVPQGTIVYTEDKKGKKIYTPSDKTQVEVPLLLLVNGYSASASEVLAGAVKDMGVGELVGEQTFGKGLVQNIFPLSDGSAVKVTIAKYYTPSGVCIQGEGIAPNHPIEMAKELSAKISTLKLEEDVQLQEAIKVMKEKLKK